MFNCSQNSLHLIVKKLCNDKYILNDFSTDFKNLSLNTLLKEMEKWIYDFIPSFFFYNSKRNSINDFYSNRLLKYARYILRKVSHYLHFFNDTMDTILT